MRRFGIAIVLLAVPVMLLAGAPDTATLDGCGDKKGPVTFPHKAHVDAGTDCVTCHHTDEGLTAENAGEVKKCIDCHLNPADEAPSCSEMSLKKNPYHATCMGCHKTEGKGPTKCDDCHAKE